MRSSLSDLLQERLERVFATIDESGLDLTDIAQRVGRTKQWLSYIKKHNRLPGDLSDLDRLEVAVKELLEEEKAAVEKRLEAVEKIIEG